MLKKFFKNKKASVTDSAPVTLFFFIILGLIGISITAGLWMYDSGSVDKRYIEAKAINDKIAYALIDNGALNKEVFFTDLLKLTKLDSDFFENTGLTYINVSILNADGRLNQTFAHGNGDYEIYCKLSGPKFPKCYIREIILLNPYNLNEKIKIKILTAVNRL